MKRIVCLFICVVIVSFAFGSFALAEDEYKPSAKLLLNDGADLLTVEQEKSLSKLMVEDSQKNEVNIAIVTVNSLNGVNEEKYADDYYYSHSLGYGDTNDCILLLIAKGVNSDGSDVRYLYTKGAAYSRMDEDDEDELINYIVGDLDSADYYSGCVKYVNKAVKLTAPWVPGWISIVIALVVGVILSSVVLAVLKGQLKSVAFKSNAADYLRPGSLNITNADDLYLYSNVTMVRKSNNNHHSGGSSSGHGGRSF